MLFKSQSGLFQGWPWSSGMALRTVSHASSPHCHKTVVAALTCAFSHDSVSEQGREREGAECSPYTLYTEKEKMSQQRLRCVLLTPHWPELCHVSPQQLLAEMTRMTMTMIDLDQSSFVPWGLGEEPIFSQYFAATTWTKLEAVHQGEGAMAVG